MRNADPYIDSWSVSPTLAGDMALGIAGITEAFPEYEILEELGDGTFKIACLIDDCAPAEGTQGEQGIR